MTVESSFIGERAGARHDHAGPRGQGGRLLRIPRTGVAGTQEHGRRGAGKDRGDPRGSGGGRASADHPRRPAGAIGEDERPRHQPERGRQTGGISLGYLSKIMSGRRSPSPGVLERLRGALFRLTHEERVMPAEVRVLGWSKGERSGTVVRGAGEPGRGDGGGAIRTGGRVPRGEGGLCVRGGLRRPGAGVGGACGRTGLLRHAGAAGWGCGVASFGYVFRTFALKVNSGVSQKGDGIARLAVPSLWLGVHVAPFAFPVGPLPAAGECMRPFLRLSGPSLDASCAYWYAERPALRPMADGQMGTPIGTRQGNHSYFHPILHRIDKNSKVFLRPSHTCPV